MGLLPEDPQVRRVECPQQIGGCGVSVGLLVVALVTVCSSDANCDLGVL